jgi:hypothetical protein
MKKLFALSLGTKFIGFLQEKQIFENPKMKQLIEGHKIVADTSI